MISRTININQKNTKAFKLLGVLRDCAINVFSLSRFGFIYGLIIFILISCKNNDDANDINMVQNLNNTAEISKLFNVYSDKIPFTHNQIYTDDFKISEPLGSGLAAIDINNDGVYELFFAQYDKNQTSSALYQFKNNRFVDITNQTGLTNINSVIGVATADINNDGWTDLLIYGYKQLKMMINKNGVFSEIKMPQLPANSFYSSATFFNANKDKYLDLWLSRYVDMDTGENPVCKGSDGLPLYCSPSSYPYQKDFLFINSNGNSFKKIINNAIDIPASPSLGVVASDFNNDELQDIFVANDGEDNHLFTQQNDGTFLEEGAIKSVSSNIAGLQEASMGVAVGDYNNNGLTDLFVTHLERETNTLYTNEKKWFTDNTGQIGLNDSLAKTGFGTGFFDLNGDNWLDLFVVNGKIQPIAYENRTHLITQLSEEPLLYINKNGHFEKIIKFADKTVASIGRGLIFLDYDNDGDIDLVSNNNNGKPNLYENNLNPDHWYGINVMCYNRIDIGAKIKFEYEDKTTIYRTVHSDGSYASASSTRQIIYPVKNNKLVNIIVEFTNQSKLMIQPKNLKNGYKTIQCKK